MTAADRAGEPAAPHCDTELLRLGALRDRNILDTSPETGFDDAVALVRTICRVPIALVSLVDADRQWFKAKIGVTATETALDTSVCALAIQQDGLFVIEDLSDDPRTAGMSLVTGDPCIRFYAGMPLITADGFALGSLCAIDTVARPGGLDAEQAAAMAAIARQVVTHIGLRGAVDVADRTVAQQVDQREAAVRAAAELRELNEAIRLGRDRLALATQAAQMGGFDYLPASDVLHWDDRCRALFGLSPGAPVTYAGTFLAGLHPEDRDRAAGLVAVALEPGGSGRFDCEYRTIGIEDGIERTIAAHGLALFEDGVAVRLIGTVQDVTEDRAARAMLLETEERLRLANRATNDAIWDWDLRRDHVLWNAALTTAYGHPPETVAPTGAWWFDRIHPDDRDRVDASIHAVIAGDGTDWAEEYRFRRGDGSHADVADRGYVIRDADGQAVRMLGALLDQTARKAAERELRQINQRLETSLDAHGRELDRLWEASPDLLLVLDFDGLVVKVNPAWTAILGYDPDDIVGRNIGAFVLPADIDRTLQALNDAVAGTLQGLENRYIHKDGSTRWFSWVAAPAGSLVYATGRHVTAEKEAAAALRHAEDQLRQAQKVEAVGQLTGGVAHDFNNLLTVIRGSVDLLRRPDLTEERRTRYIDAIADTADRAARLTSQLLAFARRSALKPETFDARASLDALHDMIGTLAGSMVTITLDLGPEPCFIHADPSQFDTAIVNMAVNARDAMERAGTIAITVSAVSRVPAIRSHGAIDGAYVAVALSDSGSGIDPDRIEHIFEPFYTTKAVGEGTGLGLSQVFGFAKQSGGEIVVRSEPGAGATFTLYLPRVRAVAQSAAAASPAGPVARGAIVLVVEDNAEVGTFATQALAELGHEAVLATNAGAALEMLAATPTRFDILFSDVVMPGMTGIELGREVRRLYPDLPVLLTSGYSSVLAQEGAHGFALLHKPYSLQELEAALQRRVPANGLGSTKATG